MKTSIILLLVVAVAAVSYGALLPQATSRTNAYYGQPGPRDRLLASNYLQTTAIVNSIQTRDLIYNGPVRTNITAVWAQEVGATQYAQAWIVAGGLGRQNVTVRAQSVTGRGFYYLVQIWGQ